MVDNNYIHSLGVSITEELYWLAKRVNKADKIIQKCYELVFCPSDGDTKKIESLKRDLKRYCKQHIV